MSPGLPELPIAVSDASGAAIVINKYDEYGIPAAGNMGRFQYTGQMWLPQVGLYHYKARAYSPSLGRFMQTDPIGYGDGVNWYNYVGGDPVNFVDPDGLKARNEYVKFEGGPGGGAGGSGGGQVGPEIGVLAHCSGGRNYAYYDKASNTCYYNEAGFGGRSEGGGGNGRTNEGGGGGGGGGKETVAKTDPTPPAPNCIGPNAGPVIATGAGFTVAAIAGGNFAAGTFKIPSIGASGTFSSGGANVGAEVAVGGFISTFGKFGDFNGKSFGASVAIPSTPFGLGASKNTFFGKFTGVTVNGGIGGGATLSYGGTKILSSNIPICGSAK